jgi:hypothetical protein
LFIYYKNKPFKLEKIGLKKSFLSNKMNNLNSEDDDFDYISELPTDKNKPSDNEYIILNTLFKEKNNINIIFKEMQDSFIVGILFILFSLPMLDTLIIKFIPVAGKLIYVLLCVKVLFIMLLFWIIKHFYLSRNK